MRLLHEVEVDVVMEDAGDVELEVEFLFEQGFIVLKMEWAYPLLAFV